MEASAPEEILLDLRNFSNSSAEVISNAIRISRDRAILFDFNEFSTSALHYMGASCAVSDLVERMPSTFRIPENNLIAAAADARERTFIIDLLSQATGFKIIATM
jgi:hypothetical protein